MADSQSIKIPAHHNIYTGNNNRDLRIDFVIPDTGTNSDTGLLIIVPGFGAHIDSNVYKKMRQQFANQYNLITVQCDYFGSEFMQSVENFKFKENLNEMSHYFNEKELNVIKKNETQIMPILLGKDTVVNVLATINESLEHFNDMGLMQAIDVITAIEAMKILLHENDVEFNEKKIIGYGHSQGAYLLHLCNRLVPHVFSTIIDNSAWVAPVYLTTNRILQHRINNLILNMEFDYLAKQVISDKAALSLFSVYENFENGALIKSYLGTNDNLVNISSKKSSISHLKFVDFKVIDDSKVDGKIFKSTGHGLDADFIELFNYSMSKDSAVHKNAIEKQTEYEITLSKTHIFVDYSYGLPLFNVEL
ncbi:DUF2920 family protein [Viridibacillus arvi]|uniref:DUF2920 family protein n=1 Tax=Viridibacillus arvi TaxID=263475 RepID=UPI00187B9D7A|nr:DUF2920 family protein [Viridibacillus sp. JNUCC-6]QOV10522.1 DUF2920 family protein [Viridibacillus sp. JNUCC-6]